MEKIDFVIDWVDDSDPDWNLERQKYQVDTGDNRSVRYRDWNLLKYWFRSVEVNAPWVNKIYFVTYGHLPSWLDINNPKLVIVNHKDYIPSEYLPTFNSNVIELLIHKIPNLSEQFILFNDDCYINKPVRKEDFFNSKGRPLDAGVLSPQLPKENSITHITTNNVEIINKYFSRIDIMKNIFKFINIKYGKQNVKTIATMPWKIILGFHDFHMPNAFNKQTFKDVWNMESNNLKRTLGNKFRTKEDYNVWIFRYFQLMRGQFTPRKASFGKYYEISDNNNSIIEDIQEKLHALIVINDSEVTDFEATKKELINSFESRYPTMSMFEKRNNC